VTRRRRRSKITPEQLASRQLQGRYLALVRQFPANRRVAFAKIAKDKGREAAFREMQESLRKLSRLARGRRKGRTLCALFLCRRFF
jgi:hypothetical protein